MNRSPAAPSIIVAWQLRDEPLPPIGVAARGDAARVLARRLLQRDDKTLAKLEGISAGEWLLFRGVAEDLPWADGAIYLGRDAAAPALLLPTLWHSAPDAALLQRALKNRFQSAASLAIVPPCAHRDAAKNAEATTREDHSAARKDSNGTPAAAPSSLEARVLADAPTLVFSLESARRISRAPLENWLHSQGEEPPVAPSPAQIEVLEDVEETEDAKGKSLIGDLRSTEISSSQNTLANARDLEGK